MNIEEYIESGQLELYALQQLSPAEAAEVERLAAEHPPIRAELINVQRALGLYAEAHAVTPPAALRERVLSSFQQAVNQAASAAEPSAPTETSAPYVVPSVAPTAPAPRYEAAPAPEAVVRSLPAESTGSGFRWLAIAASVALLLSLGANWLFYSRWQQSENQLVLAQAEQARYAATTQAVQKSLAARTQEIGVLRDEQFRMVVMTGTAQAPGARARVMYNPVSRRVYVDVKNLPAAPSGKQYQLWALDKGKPVDAGMLAQTTAVGDSLQRMKDVASAQAFAVTLEDAGGHPTPTMAALTVMGQML
ncbi:anti-sigma factor [Hymenobacter jeollabukensis]|uniref:Regulator of SigK n=1 Tax=Hymenobacter jeollabukensis TaxID=2025313 RepID=A0A5R8WWL6_9BACT|nr:anti-sigma factor [Hymenobacter jeollabukensis]TLM96739.1 anti-sigma factor [Hymenobacter jeollabukensis]